MKHYVVALLLAITAFALFIPPAFAQANASQPSIRDGVLDLAGWDLAADGPIELEGEWELYWNQLLEPGQFALPAQPVRTGVFPVPSFWNRYEVQGAQLPRYGYATYRLVITNNSSQALLGLKILHVYSAARIWVNGELLRSVGQPGQTEDTTVPQFPASSVIDMGHPGERLELIVAMSNFTNPQGGLLSGLVLGSAQQLDQLKQREVIQDSFMFGALFIMAVYHFILYLLRRKDAAPLHFSLFCLCIAVRTLLSNSKFVLDLYPELSWVWFAKLSYLTVYVGQFFITSFIYHLFSSYFSKKFVTAVRALSVGLTLLVLVTDIRIFDKSLLLFELCALIVLVYAIYAAVRAARSRQDGAALFLIGFIVVLLAALNDMLSRLTLIPTPAILQYGVLVFIFLQSVILSFKFAKTYAKVELFSERLQSLDKLKDEFLAKTSHELRTPLVGIIGLTESLIDGTLGKLSPQALHMLGLIRLSSKRLSHLVNDILDFSKMKNKDLQMRTVVVDMAQMAELVVLLLKPLADKKRLALDSLVPPKLFVYADENRLQQILHNLIGNAIKFTEQGGITLRARRDGDRVHIEVEDTGIGIAEHEQLRIFESFEQLETVMERHGGTGIGLAITKQLVELQQGHIRVSSRIGQGSLFAFTLPAAEAQPDSPAPVSPAQAAWTRLEAAAAAEPERLQTALTAQPENAPTVMIVDDDPVNIQVLANFLGGDYRIIDTCNGLEAMSWIESGMKSDIVLLDIMMPQLSGFEMCRQIRARYSSSELPILFLSAKSQITDLTTAFDLGANDYLVKPADKQELTARIRLHLKLAQWNHSLEQELTIRTIKLKKVMQETAKAMAEISVLEERTRIARDIHDQVGHTLTASIVQMEAAVMMVEKDVEAAIEKLRFVSGLIRQGLKEMRQSVHTLHEQSMELDLYSSLIKLIQDTETYAEVSIEHDIEPFAHPLPPEQETFLYRALQEGMTNGIRHGGSKHFQLMIRQTADAVLFTLINDGAPFEADALGFGLTSMKRQAERWQGTFRIGARQHGSGCQLDITIPFKGAG